MNGTFHGGDEFLPPVVVSGQDLVKPLQLAVSAEVLLVQRHRFYINIVVVALVALKPAAPSASTSANSVICRL